MDGFKREPQLIRLNFEDVAELSGFQCTMRSVSLEEFLEISELMDSLKTPAGRTKENVRRAYEVIGELLYSWNLVGDDDQPVPADYDHLKKLDFRFFSLISNGFVQANSAPPKGSSTRSAGGGPSAEESTLGLEMSSPSPAGSPAPA